MGEPLCCGPLASAPLLLPVVDGAGPIQIVHVEDVAEAVRLAIEGRVPARAADDLVEDEAHPLSDVVAAFRAWLGHPPATILAVPLFLVRPGVAVSDGLGRLGWRSPLRSTALVQVTEGVTGAPGPGGGPVLTGLRASLRRPPLHGAGALVRPALAPETGRRRRLEPVLARLGPRRALAVRRGGGCADRPRRRAGPRPRGGGGRHPPRSGSRGRDL